MADEPESVVLLILRDVQARLGRIEDGQREVVRRLGRIEQSTAYAQVAHAEQQLEIDRLRERVDRIEQRLELRDQ